MMMMMMMMTRMMMMLMMMLMMMMLMMLMLMMMRKEEKKEKDMLREKSNNPNLKGGEKQDFRVQEATQNDQRSDQDGLKTVFFGFFFRFVFCIDFWTLFDAILVPFWRGLGRPTRDF